MSKKLNLKDKWVIVTGASSGLGRQLCIDLSEKYSAKIIAVARRSDKLLSLQERISESSEIKIISLDVTNSQNLKTFFEEITEQLEISFVILNAGITKLKSDYEINLDFKKQIINTNVIANIEIMHLAINYFLNNKVEGGILIISSLAASFPIPGQAIYSGTKSFLYSYVRAIQWELRKQSIHFSICLPGGIKTEMINEDHLNSLDKWLVTTQEASKKTLNAFIKGKFIITLSLADRFLMMISPLLPRKLFNRILDLIYKDLYQIKK